LSSDQRRYLLARAADTITDTRLIQVSRRHEALQQLRAKSEEACENSQAAPGFGDLAEAQQTIAGEGTPGERALLEHFGNYLASFSHGAQRSSSIGRLLDTITRGQKTTCFISAPS
jgi:hypothetical protein